MPTYVYSIRARDTRGLDPALYKVLVAVQRVDDKALGEDELKAIRAALAPEAVREPEPKPDLAKPVQTPKVHKKAKPARPATQR